MKDWKEFFESFGHAFRRDCDPSAGDPGFELQALNYLQVTMICSVFAASYYWSVDVGKHFPAGQNI